MNQWANTNIWETFFKYSFFGRPTSRKLIFFWVGCTWNGLNHLQPNLFMCFHSFLRYRWGYLILTVCRTASLRIVTWAFWFAITWRRSPHCKGAFLFWVTTTCILSNYCQSQLGCHPFTNIDTSRGNNLNKVATYTQISKKEIWMWMNKLKYKLKIILDEFQHISMPFCTIYFYMFY